MFGPATLVQGRGRSDHDALRKDVRHGLLATPKRLPFRWFYDEEGSRLFDEICTLPEYYLPRAEREILEAHADELAGVFPSGPTVVELGSGTAVKTRIVLEAILRRHGSAHYVPVDIAGSVLVESSRSLRSAYPSLGVTALHGDYDDALAEWSHFPGAPRLVLWLGSNIGNFEREEATDFLGKLRERLKPGDRVLVGIDLIKDRAVLEAAYNDSRGVTARFNKNMIVRMMRELGAEFDLSGFSHRAFFNEATGCIEMHLLCDRPQRVDVRALGLQVDFSAGESIHTESSHKYSREEIEALATSAGLAVEHVWTDREGLLADVVMGLG
ncbi:MAG: L-histidine N(alpha)-methyltransferase [Deltaproteobacteria bacterium]|nr:L-histidine N(alpha)-methyltransferase [Deltaproteobacteria bacterium]